VNIIARRNIRANFLRIKQPGEPNITFANEAEVYPAASRSSLVWSTPTAIPSSSFRT
jgi:hypothetical protein